MIRSILKQNIFVRSFRLDKKYLTSKSDVKNQINRPHYQNRRKTFVWSEEEHALASVFQELKEQIIDDQLVYHAHVSGLREDYRKLLDYTCDLDPLFLSSSLTAVRAYKYFEKPSNLTEKTIKLSAILGWCLRLTESSMIVIDDIMDNSAFRYNKATWYKTVGLDTALADAVFLNTSVYYMLLRHFSSHPQFVNITRELLVNYATTHLSLMLEARPNKLEDIERNQNYVKAYPMTLPPVTAALYLANIDDPELHTAARNFCIDVGIFLKYEDDVYCVYRPSSLTKKHCTDAEKGRPTWFGLQVNRLGSEEQKKTFVENYGKSDEKSLKQVYKIFEDLRLKAVYDDYVEEFYETMYEKLETLPKGLPKQFFADMLDYAILQKYRS